MGDMYIINKWLIYYFNRNIQPLFISIFIFIFYIQEGPKYSINVIGWFQDSFSADS